MSARRRRRRRPGRGQPAGSRPRGRSPLRARYCGGSACRARTVARARTRKTAVVMVLKSLRLGDEIVRLGPCLDRVLCALEVALANEDDVRVGVGVGLELGIDTGAAEDLFDLLRLANVACDGCVDHLAHCALDDKASGARRWRAPSRTSWGVPRSANGTSMTSKSRGTTVSGKSSRASLAISGPK